MFLSNDRVSATFKDPNVYGPFLIFPLLLLMTALMTRGIRLSDSGDLGRFARRPVPELFARRLDAFRRLGRGRGRDPPRVTTPDPRMRARILLFAVVTAVGMVLLVVALMSIDSVHDLFLERAKAIQPYDVGPGGRFWEQQLALGVILDHPNGMGPFEFSRVFGMQQHDVYMQGFLVYGWLGGAAYLTLVAGHLGDRARERCSCRRRGKTI